MIDSMRNLYVVIEKTIDSGSAYTVQGNTMSAGRLYDKIGKKAKAKIDEDADEVKFGTKYEEEEQ